MKAFLGQTTATSAAFEAGNVAAVTVTAVDCCGVSITLGAATYDATTLTYKINFTPSTLGVSTLTWSAAGGVFVKTSIETVGAPIFTIQEARQFGPLSDVTKFTDSALAQARDYVLEEFTRICNRSFVQRRASARIEVLNGSGFLPSVDTYNVVSVNGSTSVYGASVSPIGEVTTVGADATGYATVVYDYGLASVPEDVKVAALTRARHLIATPNSKIPERAVNWAPETGGSYALAVAGRSGWETGIPDVDAVLSRYRFTAVGVG